MPYLLLNYLVTILIVLLVFAYSYYHLSSPVSFSVAGCRSVPIELGSSYLSQDYSQKLMTVEQFIRTYITSRTDANPVVNYNINSGNDFDKDVSNGIDTSITGSHINKNQNSEEEISCDNNTGHHDLTYNNQNGNCHDNNHKANTNKTHSRIGYLAQHRLFDQVPELLRDIITPDYCALLLPTDEHVDIDNSLKHVQVQKQNNFYHPV